MELFPTNAGLAGVNSNGSVLVSKFHCVSLADLVISPAETTDEAVHSTALLIQQQQTSKENL